jgi:hypothetical protein
MTQSLTQWTNALQQLLNAETTIVRDSVDARRATGLAVLMDIIPMRDGGGSDKLRWSVDISATGGGNYDRSTGVPGSDTDKENLRAELPWAGIDAGFTLAPEILALDPTTLAPGALGVVIEELQKATADVYRTIEDQMLGVGSSSPVQTIIGLRGAIQAATTYAGINASTTAKWASLITSTSTYLDKEALQTFLASLRGARRGRPEIAVTGYARYQQLVNEIQSTQSVTVAPQVQIGGASLTGLNFEGVNIIPVNDFPNTGMYFFNRGDVELVLNGGMKVVQLAQPTYNQRWKVVQDCQLRVRDPYRCGAFTALTDAA